jgi:hypothetical protein
VGAAAGVGVGVGAAAVVVAVGDAVGEAVAVGDAASIAIMTVLSAGPLDAAAEESSAADEGPGRPGNCISVESALGLDEDWVLVGPDSEAAPAPEFAPLDLFAAASFGSAG